MIEFKLPNFRVRVSEIKIDESGETVIAKERRWRYCYAENKDQAIALITRRNQFTFVHENTIEALNFNEEWGEDVNETILAIKAALAQKLKPDFPSHWGILKEHLIDLFDGKCGYCEARFTPTSFGDVEHYRPKGRVYEDTQHTGYHWLAYEPANYLPACQLCNEPAKRDHFPIAGTRAQSAADPLDAEDPLLINPYYDFYAEHLEFIPSTAKLMPGGVKGKTEKGKRSVSILEIYRDPIREERRQEMVIARRDIKDAYKKLIDSEDWDEFGQDIRRYLSEDRPFRTAVYYEFRDYLIRIKDWDEAAVKQAFAALGFKTE